MQYNIPKRKKKKEKEQTSNDLKITKQKTKYWATPTLLKPGVNDGTPEGLSDPAQPVIPVKFFIWCINRVRCKYLYIYTNDI